MGVALAGIQEEDPDPEYLLTIRDLEFEGEDLRIWIISSLLNFERHFRRHCHK